MLEDLELLRAWRDGDSAAGSTLVERHFSSVYRFFRNKIDGDLEDLVQLTFMKCTQARNKIGPDSNFRAYLFAIARNVVAEHYRKAHRGPEIDFAASSVADLGATPTGVLAQRQEHQILLAALRAIPLDDQVALELMYWERLTGREMAAVLDIPEGTVRTRLRNARAKLATEIEGLGQSGEALQSTLDNIERWSGAIREYLAQDG